MSLTSFSTIIYFRFYHVAHQSCALPRFQFKIFMAGHNQTGLNFVSLCPCCLPDGGCHVGVPVHEALHGRGDVPPPPGLLPTSPQQLLRLLRPVPPSGRLGRTRSQPVLHLLRGLPPDELLQLPRSAQVSGVRTDVLIALLSRKTSGGSLTGVKLSQITSDYLA